MANAHVRLVLQPMGKLQYTLLHPCVCALTGNAKLDCTRAINGPLIQPTRCIVGVQSPKHGGKQQHILAIAHKASMLADHAVMRAQVQLQCVARRTPTH